MVAHLEAVPSAKAVVNFAPILLEQIAEYATQIKRFLQDGSIIKDTLLAALSGTEIPGEATQRLKLIKDCKKANRERQILRYPEFTELIEMADWMESHPQAIEYANDQFFFDLLAWYHLVWMGETVKLSDSRVQKLLKQGKNYNSEDRCELIQVIHDLLNDVIDRYRVLAEQGRIELSVTPYAHPIMPLMLDLETAHEAMPDAPLPELEHYPGGEARVKWHLQKGLETFQSFFGFKPAGCWPSEGGISTRTLEILAEFDFIWTASGGNVLHNSLNAAGADQSIVHCPYQVQGLDQVCFFRDDGLSDLIGFEYSRWHADDAVADLIHHLENIASHESEGSVVSIIMDGENAWEYFPENGYHFLNALYRRLTDHPGIELSTFSDCLMSDQVKIKPLSSLIAGSWVYGTFSTWIGSQDKNRGWDMLGDVKQTFDQVIESGRLTAHELVEAEYQLAICEGSDWFWWFGDYNPGDAVSDFEKQYRMNLKNLYYLLEEEPPEYLAMSFTHGIGEPDKGGAMRRGNKNSPQE